MPYCYKLPSLMCMSCKFMNYDSHSSPAYFCKDSGSFTNSSKLNCEPDKDGTASECKAFQPK